MNDGIRSMTVGNVILNNAIANRDVSSQSLASQGSSAANTISAFKPIKSSVKCAVQQSSQATYFASLTQAYKDSYDKYQKENGNVKSLSLKSLAKLDKILEEDNKEETKRKLKRDNSKAFEPVDFLA
ncbi:MAG: hypothetical protein AB7V50_05190 [Vampirovibrionia bacterium]